MDGDGGIADSRGERTVQRRDAKELFNADMSSDEQVRFVSVRIVLIVRRASCVLFSVWVEERRWREMESLRRR